MSSFDYFKIDEYQLEITTYCNAACPQCPRNISGGSVNPHMPLCHLSRETIDRAFTPELCGRIRQIFFCGSYGDPIVHPDFLEIVRDLRNKNPKLWLYVHTNGGVHDSDWWKELAEIFGSHGQVDFNIDGLQDTNHLYRRNVDFDRAINNAQTFIHSGGRAKWNYIVFEHNQHQVETAKLLSSIIGFSEIVFRGTGRFLNHKTLEEKDHWDVIPTKQESYQLNPTTL